MEKMKNSVTPHDSSDNPSVQTIAIDIDVPQNTDSSYVLLPEPIPVSKNIDNCHVPSPKEIPAPENSDDCYVPGSSQKASPRNITSWEEYFGKHIYVIID